VAIGFAPGTFLTPEPSVSPRPSELPAWVHVLSGSVGLASLAALGAAVVSRVRAGRGVPRHGTVIAQYTEPEGINVVQSAHLLWRSSSGIPAAIVRLAVRKNLRILAYAVDAGGPPYTLQYLTDDGADDFDQTLLKAVFGPDRTPGAVTPYGKYNSSLALKLQKASDAALTSLQGEGLRRPAPGRRFGWSMLVAQWILLPIIFLIVVISETFFIEASPLIFLAMPVSFFAGFVTFILAIRPPQLTEAGRAARDHLDGLKLYLTVAEEERLRVLQSPQGAERIDVGDNLQLVKLYEKLLPWAVVWGVEDQWMRELAVRVAATDTTPDWFVGANGFETALFSTAVRGVITTTSATVSSSSWSGSSGGSSFSGGSFGGGFSGGGGGGGGGGGR
jgi:uncharacterized membrane protein YgcG